ncbi:hypothetical protein SLE2022_253400 [Rubroshorea leprosula]
MAQAKREMEEFKEANWTRGGEWKIEKTDSNSLSASPNAWQPISNNGHAITPTPPRSRLAPPYLPAPQPWKTKSDVVYRAIDYSKYSKYTAHKPSHSWGGESELSRKRRVVMYNSYTAENQMKTSLRNGFRWVKNKYSQIVYGY